MIFNYYMAVNLAAIFGRVLYYSCYGNAPQALFLINGNVPFNIQRLSSSGSCFESSISFPLLCLISYHAEKESYWLCVFKDFISIGLLVSLALFSFQGEQSLISHILCGPLAFIFASLSRKNTMFSSQAVYSFSFSSGKPTDNKK